MYARAKREPAAEILSVSEGYAKKMVRPERFELPTYSSGGNLEPLGQRGISALQRAQWAVKRHYWLQLNTFCTRSAVRES